MYIFYVVTDVQIIFNKPMKKWSPIYDLHILCLPRNSQFGLMLMFLLKLVSCSEWVFWRTEWVFWCTGLMSLCTVCWSLVSCSEWAFLSTAVCNKPMRKLSFHLIVESTCWLQLAWSIFICLQNTQGHFNKRCCLTSEGIPIIDKTISPLSYLYNENSHTRKD